MSNNPWISFDSSNPYQLRGLAIYNNTLYILESGSKSILSCSSVTTGAAPTTLATYTSLASSVGSDNLQDSLAVDTSGNLYFATTTNGITNQFKIYKVAVTTQTIRPPIW